MITSVLRTMLSVSLVLSLALPVFAAKQKPADVTTVKSGSDTLTVDSKSKEVRVPLRFLKTVPSLLFATGGGAFRRS